ncbi:glycosyltransferase [Flammeovirga sp. SJP92]|uniref:glycosyltransferase n=1 Tax=Flammeovirga sp. SJP92 TaxID=1775430 RepID=UPI000789750F|nr:glycosyltransferase [Flammeovirga sp. SJP92]KXX68571.1 hypothetical protein AVL50_22690 [Flammeovirga sp. SJP92]
MKKNIVSLVPEDSMNGAEFFLNSFLSEAQKQNYAVSVFFLKKHKHNLWSKEKELNFTNSKTEKFGILPLIKNLLYSNSRNSDLIITSHFHLNILVSVLAKLRVITPNRIVFRESSIWLRRVKGIKLSLYKTLYRMFYLNCDLLICQTEEMKEVLLSEIPELVNVKIKVLRNPINYDEVKNKIKLTQFRGDKLIVAAGRLHPIKGFDILIESFHKLIENDERLRSLKLLILGEGTERDKLEILVKKLKLEDNVHLYGYSKYPFKYFEKAELCVVSSIKEGFPNVLHQMMVNNSNVLSTRCAEGIESINGLLTCKPNSVEELYLLMKKALERSDFEKENSSTEFAEYTKKNSIENYFKRVMAEINF